MLPYTPLHVIPFSPWFAHCACGQLTEPPLEDSTRTLRSTANLYDTYTSLLEASGNLIKQLEKADWWDRLTILAAFLFFLLCVGWILKRRILDKVVGGVGWWVGGSFRLLGMGLGLGGKKGAAPAMMSAAGTAAGLTKGSGAGAGAGAGPGKVGKTPEGMGRVGLAGGREKVGGMRDLELEDGSRKDGVADSDSVLDHVVPPASSGDSAVRAVPRQAKDEL